MAKGAYVGVDGAARKVKTEYMGVSGAARKVKKSYVGVGGAARESWSTQELAFTASVSMEAETQFGLVSREWDQEFFAGFPGYSGSWSLGSTAVGQTYTYYMKISGVPDSVHVRERGFTVSNGKTTCSILWEDQSASYYCNTDFMPTIAHELKFEIII